MSHYFESPEPSAAPAREREVTATIWGRDHRFTSANGVFSGSRLDPGTAVLFRETTPPAGDGIRLLDLGSGFGPITVALAAACPGASVDAVDVNSRAVELTRANASSAGVGDQVFAGSPDEVLARDARYEQIWSNPPIRIGKQALHELLLTWLPRLAPGGEAWLVVSKNLGADSLQQWLVSEGWACAKHASAKGFRVLRVTRPEDD
ncbi:class I SAM-dependent methyltransferase [Propionibacteriaceae bacterium G57]|uniref:class I SAM-dependent methyltransferase n=1 Tax=Aestuariimicrobium sp. G57 TaxID=3418485 RepID=UPI003DA6F92A